MSQARSRTRTNTSTRLTRQDYPLLLRSLPKLAPAERLGVVRRLCRTDLFFLLRYGLDRPDAEHDWILERCREVQADPDGHLDLWARFHYKSTIITFALTIQDILNDPEVTFGFFSHNRPTAKSFLRQIMREFETNKRLKEWFPDILWERPEVQAPKWSEDDGIVVKRKGNPKESTVEAWGLVDGQPTSKHFKKRVYDDVVTQDSVGTPQQILKTTQAWEHSQALKTLDGGPARYVGTRYHFADTYKVMLDRKSAKPRIHTATKNGQPDGEPVLLSAQGLKEIRRDMGPYTFGAQMLLNPQAVGQHKFLREWLRSYRDVQDGAGMNIYIIVDPANSKKKDSDNTAMAVIGMAKDRNYYLLDAVRDRLNLAERTRALFDLHRLWKPNAVGYEKYGKDADIEHILEKQELENYRFAVTELGGSVSKNDRIEGLIPIFEQGRFWMPERLPKNCTDGVTHDLVHELVEEELLPFPFATKKDLLDACARITDDDLGALWPKDAEPENYDVPDAHSAFRSR